MDQKKLSIISDFNTEPLSRILSTNYESSIKCEKVLFGQVYQSLFETFDINIGLIWTQPQNIITEFGSNESAKASGRSLLIALTHS